MKRFNYLLGQTELFQHFIDLKVSFILTLQEAEAEIGDRRDNVNQLSQPCWTSS
jgi:hypothetical protein